MRKFSKKSLVSSLRQEGLTFSEFTLTHEGEYTVDDADWNYKDVPHLHYVHELAEAIPAVVGDDLIATINMQKVLMFRFPFALFNFESGPNTQTYYTTWLWYVLIIETAYESLGPCRTRVNTTYSIGCPPLLRWTFPILKWVLKRNYDNLMSTDIPMRTRRGQLRTWGYSFFKEDERYSFEKTIDITQPNVIAPDTDVKLGDHAIEIARAMPGNSELFVGRDDVWGIRLVREGNVLSLFPRLCPHEGASLDGTKCRNKKVQCPWHGRTFEPLAEFDLTSPQVQEAQIGTRLVKFHGGVITIPLPAL
jgi:nitrite reductase/ring-hydroxylating ferredoxin subunit